MLGFLQHVFILQPFLMTSLSASRPFSRRAFPRGRPRCLAAAALAALSVGFLAASDERQEAAPSPAEASGDEGGETETSSVKGYPAGVEARSYPSDADGSEQPTLYWAPELAEGERVPLLVALHTWGGSYRQAGGEAKYAEWCQSQGWIFVHPHFRGPNRTPQAMGSDLAAEDIRSVVAWAKALGGVDEDRIYAVGASGGGHASLLVAGRYPEIWAGVSAWCGISDIAAWHRETSAAGRANYASDIERALGGAPDSSDELLAEAGRRSPLAWLAAATKVPLDINHGIADGRSGSVPFTHSLHAWNAVVPESERFDAEWIERYYETMKPPGDAGGAEGSAEPDPLYGKRPPLYRREHGNTRLTLFDGGHEIVHEAALNWLAAQRRGVPAVWDPPKVGTLESSDEATKSGL